VVLHCGDFIQGRTEALFYQLKIPKFSVSRDSATVKESFFAARCSKHLATEKPEAPSNGAELPFLAVTACFEQASSWLVAPGFEPGVTDAPPGILFQRLPGSRCLNHAGDFGGDFRLCDDGRACQESLITIDSF
jgi:hypothetical protein